MGPGCLEFIAIRRVYMGLWGQGSRGRGISAIGGWQWRRGLVSNEGGREPSLQERMFSGTGFTPIPRLHGGRL